MAIRPHSSLLVQKIDTLTQTSQLYQAPDAPQFIKGHAVSMAFVATSTLIYIAFWVWFRRQNRRRDEGEQDKRCAGLSEAEVEELGEYNPRFRYTY